MAGSHIFLDIEFKRAGTVQGESEYGGFENQIELLDFDWSMQLNEAQGVDNKRSVTLADVNITKRFDEASVKLMNCLNARDAILVARITVAHRVSESDADANRLRKSFVLEMTKARLESIDLDMTEDDRSIVLQENLKIRFTKMRIERYAIEKNGNYSNKAMVYESAATDNLEMDEA